MSHCTVSTLSTVLLVLLGVLGKGETLHLDEFYPFGKHAGDAKIGGGAEGVQAWVDLSTPVVFYGKPHEGLYVNRDGVISFNQPASPFSKHVVSKKSKHFPVYFKILSPFFTNVHTSPGDGGVFFRETQDKALLLRATTEVRIGFGNEKTFQVSSVFVATWVKVGYNEQHQEKVNTFQAVLASDGNKTFALFHYDNPVTKRRAESAKKAQNGLRVPYAKVGFSLGDESREFHLPGSGTRNVNLLSRFTNFNRPGKWVYMIGSLQLPEVNIVSAISRLPQSMLQGTQRMTGNKGCYFMSNLTSYGDLARSNIKTAKDCNNKCGLAGFTLALFHNNDGCMCAEEEVLRGSYKQWNVEGKCEGKYLFNVYRTDDVMMGFEGKQDDLINSGECGEDGIKCSESAACIIKSSSYCCVCNDGYYGNGRTCLKDGIGVHVVGELAGNINGIAFEDVKFSVYSDIQSRTTFVSLDSVPRSVGWLLRVLIPIATTPGFLFAFPGSSVDNGLSLMGSSFFHRTEVTFETDETCYIRETFMGTNENGDLNFKTEINGKVPNFNETTAIAYDDYSHYFRYDRLGVISGFYETSFNAGHQKHEVSVVEAWEFNEDRGCFNIVDFKMAVSEQRSMFEKENNILRFSQKTGMVDNGLKLCGERNQQCGLHAKCIVKEGVEFCDCNTGFNGDGYSCKDVDECLMSIHECSENAHCLNTAGSYICTCRKGYKGDGRNCRFENVDGFCGEERVKCGARAQCVVSNSGVESCECNIGFYQSGSQCQDVNECSLIIHNCSLLAECKNTPGSYTCACSKGYEGDGNTCRISSGDACTADGIQCGTYGECVRGFCRCATGYLNDGLICKDANECELGIHNCAKNATCVNNFGSFSCTCNKGYLGDGFKCTFQETRPLEGCNGAKCHDDAECDRTGEVAVCTCKTGYQGNGLSCIDVNECNKGEELSSCHGNAFCYNTPGSFRCECRLGYDGDGLQCSDINECSKGGDLSSCHGNAFCYNTPGSYSCVCRSGYKGNGLECTAVDPCKDLKCGANAECVVKQGSAVCQCHVGFYKKGKDCRAVDPCKDLKCGANADCVVKQGSAVCQCRVGFYKKGKDCRDLNECEANRDACDENAKCVNIAGSYTCFCSPGYFGNGYSCKSDGSCGGSKCHWNAKCVELNDTRRCLCNSGFVGSGLVCSDLDECANSTLRCPKLSRCLNTPGSYKCPCDSGYQWNGIECRSVCLRCLNGGTCTETGCLCREGYSGERCQWAGDEFLMFTQGSTIQRSSLPPRQESVGVLLETSSGLIVALDYDNKNKYIYFTDVSGKAIWRVKYNGTGAEKIITSGLSSPEGIAVDYIGGNIYWTDSMFDRIEVANLNGGNRKLLFSTRLVNPRSIVLHPQKGTLYWADWNRAFPKIEVANMDGGSRHVFIQIRKMGLPNGLSIDRRNNELCWTDATFGSISCANLDDGKPQVIYSSASYPFGLTSFGQHLIWTDWTTRTIHQYDRVSFKLMPSIRRLKGRNGVFYGIKIVRRSPEIGVHQCLANNGGCSHLCLPRPGGRSCACPNSFHFANRPDNTSSFSAGEGVTDSADAGTGSGSRSGLGLGNGRQSDSTQSVKGTRVQLSEEVCVPDSNDKVK